MIKINMAKKGVIKENNLTYDDYAIFNNQNQYELVQGKLEVMSPSPSTIHQSIIEEMYKYIDAHCYTNYFIYFPNWCHFISHRCTSTRHSTREPQKDRYINESWN